ncbi:MAG TPA: M36 family metallopeptidase, partial [Pirellulaceae bacterium]|nr:M36 family metallopeptidase [Pirellulaceae bacterium]
MKTLAPSASRKSRRNLRQANELHRQGRTRKMFFESLEPRQMLTYTPGEIAALDQQFPGNYLPPQHAQLPTNGSLLSTAATGNRTTLALNYLSANAASFGLTANDFTHSVVTDNYISNGIRHIYVQQTFNGLPVVDAKASVHILQSTGQIVSASANFVPNLPHPTNPAAPTPEIAAQDAFGYFASALGTPLSQPITLNSQSPDAARLTVITAPDYSAEPINMQLHYVPRPDGSVALGWRINFFAVDHKHWWDATVGAQWNTETGKVLNLTDWLWGASYNVFARPTQDPFDGPRTIVVDPHDAAVASPFGWHDANFVAGPEFLDTRGNNVSAQEDQNADDQGGNRPTSPTLDFDPPLVLPSSPFTYTDATTTNVFYWVNLVHDVTFNHGFDEASGNYQQVNRTGQGRGNDRIIADVQDP